MRSIALSLAFCLSACTAFTASGARVMGASALRDAMFAGTATIPAHGLSAIEVSEDGQRFVALSDRGRMIHGTLTRDKDRLDRAQIDGQADLTDAQGTIPNKFGRDSEGLAIGPDGTVIVSYETRHRLQSHRADGSFIARIAPPHVLVGNRTNSGIEALARSPDGTLYAMPEQNGGAYPVWRSANGEWEQAFSLSTARGFAPVGADIGPDGRLYILERRFIGVGFAARLRAVDLNGENGVEIARFPPGTHGNLEGLAVWRDAAGHLRATMVEDDNEQPFQRGGIVEYLIPD